MDDGKVEKDNIADDGMEKERIADDGMENDSIDVVSINKRLQVIVKRTIFLLLIIGLFLLISLKIYDRLSENQRYLNTKVISYNQMLVSDYISDLYEIDDIFSYILINYESLTKDDLLDYVDILNYINVNRLNEDFIYGDSEVDYLTQTSFSDGMLEYKLEDYIIDVTNILYYKAEKDEDFDDETLGFIEAVDRMVIDGRMTLNDLYMIGRYSDDNKLEEAYFLEGQIILDYSNTMAPKEEALSSYANLISKYESKFNKLQEAATSDYESYVSTFVEPVLNEEGVDRIVSMVIDMFESTGYEAVTIVEAYDNNSDGFEVGSHRPMDDEARSMIDRDYGLSANKNGKEYQYSLNILQDGNDSQVQVYLDQDYDDEGRLYGPELSREDLDKLAQTIMSPLDNGYLVLDEVKEGAYGSYDRFVMNYDYIYLYDNFHRESENAYVEIGKEGIIRQLILPPAYMFIQPLYSKESFVDKLDLSTQVFSESLTDNQREMLSDIEIIERYNGLFFVGTFKRESVSFELYKDYETLEYYQMSSW